MSPEINHFLLEREDSWSGYLKLKSWCFIEDYLLTRISEAPLQRSGNLWRTQNFDMFGKRLLWASVFEELTDGGFLYTSRKDLPIEGRLLSVEDLLVIVTHRDKENQGFLSRLGVYYDRDGKIYELGLYPPSSYLGSQVEPLNLSVLEGNNLIAQESLKGSAVKADRFSFGREFSWKGTDYLLTRDKERITAQMSSNEDGSIEISFPWIIRHYPLVVSLFSDDYCWDMLPSMIDIRVEREEIKEFA